MRYTNCEYKKVVKASSVVAAASASAAAAAADVAYYFISLSVMVALAATLLIFTFCMSDVISSTTNVTPAKLSFLSCEIRMLVLCICI